MAAFKALIKDIKTQFGPGGYFIHCYTQISLLVKILDFCQVCVGIVWRSTMLDL